MVSALPRPPYPTRQGRDEVAPVGGDPLSETAKGRGQTPRFVWPLLAARRTLPHIGELLWLAIVVDRARPVSYASLVKRGLSAINSMVALVHTCAHCAFRPRITSS